MHLRRSTVLTLVGVTSFSLLGLTFVDSNENIDNVLHSVFVALLASAIFYAGTVALPEFQRRGRIRTGLRRQYRSFKKSCIDLFLIASNSQEYDNRDNLLDPVEFRRYFSNRVNESQTRWDLVATAIDDHNYLFDELVREFESLIREVNYARSSVDIHDEEVQEFFNRTMDVVHRIKATKPGTDDYKYFCRNLWGIFARWDFATGQRDDDILKTMIERI